ncbi:MAG TPA: LysR substrate-binding domain-containing protein [Kouleothrix sp.]|uniref:LysR family transcriptional regulator n=1 Tax=Kouleothrix sp. TaxID=2779161 RepID=UPI002C86C63D|nr:LysR substrate-binding domain-containing protein [Kouleothrix sp.]HRC74231.1 LysR substrate-binding domain-containing protein [Kouleothrix sp.]
MELRHLVYFEAVARHQHVSQAAAELSVAQPAVSRQIRDLENELGVALFERVGRNVRLTDAGYALLDHVRIVLAQLEAARAEMRERVGLHSGRAAIGAPPSVGVQLLPPILAQFNQQYPRLQLVLREGGTQTMLSLLETGEVDLAVVTLPVARRGLHVTTLFSEELVIVVAPSHPLAARKHVALAGLSGEAFLLYPRGYGMREQTLLACAQAGFTPRIVLDGGEMDMVLRMAELGLGIALMPRLALHGNTRLAALRVSDQKLRRTMALVSREDRALAPAARALREFLETRLAELPPASG